MPNRARVVVDTNALVSRLLIPNSVPARAVRKAVDQSTLVVCDETLDELADVLSRNKFDRYLTAGERQDFIRLLGSIAEWIPVVPPIRARRDPRDDKFLALAVGGRADVIITGDRDLLALQPFREISIVTPADYIASSAT
jgi:putative PIN family toxin of toxin-antitoxin system